jgi:hypothetical protein
MSAPTMPLRVEVRDLTDGSPPDDRSRLFGGAIATAQNTLPGDLSASVTSAILENFQLDEVFAEVSAHPEAADLVMSGTIRRFYAKAHENFLIWTLLAPSGIGTYLAYLGLPVYGSYGQVDLELTFDTPAGQRVSAYVASREFSEWASMYCAPHHGIGARLNRMFSEVMADVREQMVADRARLLEFRPGLATPASGAEPDPDPEDRP